MKLIKLSTDHYIIVDDSEIKEGDWVYQQNFEKTNNQIISIKTEFQSNVANDKNGSFTKRKITHSTQPGSLGMGWMQSVQPLFLSEVKELTGEVDVEKKAQIQWGNVHRTGVLGYIEGYNQCLEDNKDRKYTEEDMRKAYYQGHKSGLGSESSLTFEKTIESLLPKTEWEVTFDEQGKLKLI
jgi:hypothetical protein